MPHGNVHALFTVDQFQKAKHIVKIIQRFTDTHQHDVIDGKARIKLGEQYLIQHFKGLQFSNQAAQGGGAEGATHAASHFGGNADRIAVVIAHQHRLHAVAILQLPQVLDGAVPLGLLLADGHRRIQRILLRQGIPQIFGQVGHLVVTADALMEPGVDLLSTESGLPQLF